MNRVLTFISIAILASAGVWQIWLGPRWTQRISPDWRWEANFLGTGSWPDAETGQFPDEDYITPYNRVMSVVPAAASAGAVWLEDHYITRDVATGDITWEYIYRAEVDPRTGLHTASAYAGDYFVFPRQVQRQTYSMRFTTFKGLPFEFQGEEELEELHVYRFGYYGYAEYTESYASTENFQGVDVEPGQDIRCRDDMMDVTMWVEPTTGEIAKVTESCTSGDFVYDTATNTPLYGLARWAGETAGDDVFRRASDISARRTIYLAAAYYVPVGLLAIGLLVLGVAVLAKRR